MAVFKKSWATKKSDMLDYNVEVKQLTNTKGYVFDDQLIGYYTAEIF